jgi:hypothetical protein
VPHQLLFGTPGLIRTDRTTPFERVDFTNLSTGAFGGGSGETRTHDRHRMKVAH